MNTVEITELWERTTDGCYRDEPTYGEAECQNCGVEYENHDDDECGDMQFNTVDRLDTATMEKNNTAELFLTAYEASKDTPYDALPAYDDLDEWNPLNVLNDWMMSNEIPDSVDAEALGVVHAWLEGWSKHSSI